MPLARSRESFDHPDWIFELKHDGFRALAYVDGHRCSLISRRGHIYKSWPLLNEEIAHSVRADSAVLDGEICCLDADGRTQFYSLMYRRDWPFFYAFDLLWLNGQDVCGQPLLARKRLLRRIMPRVASRLLFVDHLERRGNDLFAAACQHDLEGIVAKWKRAPYGLIDGASTWVKIKNRAYSQMFERHELFRSRAASRRQLPHRGLLRQVRHVVERFSRGDLLTHSSNRGGKI